MRIHLYLIIIISIITLPLLGQNSVIRGTVLEGSTGNPVLYADVYLEGTTYGTTTDIDGFFNITGIDAGTYTLIIEYIGYGKYSEEITLKSKTLKSVRIELEQEGVGLDEVQISARSIKAKKNVTVSSVSINPSQIQSLPSTGGEADIAQYLPVLPGIIFSGDQGGQLYIRGGSPVQNKIMIDGMTIFNPFHSIGFFSVFETEAIKNAEVLTGGFSGKYGNRISAIVDIQTRAGNKKNHGGLISASPFQAKVLLEGPIVPLRESGDAAISYLITGKTSLLKYTGETLYGYAQPARGSGLPYDYTDLFGKISLLAGNGSEINLFGFRFTDNVDYPDVASLDWNAAGGGIEMKIIPSLSNTILNGRFSVSAYDILFDEFQSSPRTNTLNNYNFQLDILNFGYKSEMNYGIGFDALQTEFSFTNRNLRTFTQSENAVELFGFLVYKQELGKLILEPSVRATYYASLGTARLEPRFGLKYNITDKIRFKGAGGIYSQNLISSVNEKDIVNLFVAFLLGPSGTILDTQTGKDADSRLQKSIHGVAGFEFDLPKGIGLNVEAYYKRFNQLISINRNKVLPTEPNYVTEIGDAYGLDFTLDYSTDKLYIWTTYSLGYVFRDDGEQVYPTIFDRRHNINFLATYKFGDDNSWEASARWNFGTGFPFTLTDGFYSEITLNDKLIEEILTENPEVGIIYDTKRNAGRLPSYHRLDISVKKSIEFNQKSSLELVGSVTNAYNRKNIFYFDRVEYDRVDQLPILPSISATYKF